MNATTTLAPDTKMRRMLNKVPEVTIYFWVIKVLCTTVGETFADNLTTSWAGGDSASDAAVNSAHNQVMIVTFGLLAVLLAVQFSLKRYVAPLYWTIVVVVSVAGTQITDKFEGNGAQPAHMWAITIVSLALLALVFLAWWLTERTLSMHSIRTHRREAFYWLAILTTFAAGTAVGDLVAEKFSLGYLPSLLVFAGVIAAIAVGRFGAKLNAVLMFWLAYIMTRPLGASMGDLLSQKDNGGLGLGTSGTSYIFLAAIAIAVAYLTIRKPDVTPVEQVYADEVHHPHLGHPHLGHPRRPEGRTLEQAPQEG